MHFVQPGGHQLYPFSSSSKVVICPRQHVRNRTSHVHTIQNIVWAVAAAHAGNKKNANQNEVFMLWQLFDIECNSITLRCPFFVIADIAVHTFFGSRTHGNDLDTPLICPHVSKFKTHRTQLLNPCQENLRHLSPSPVRTPITWNGSDPWQAKD